MLAQSCDNCKAVKELDMFGLGPGGRHGRKKICKSCSYSLNNFKPKKQRRTRSHRTKFTPEDHLRREQELLRKSDVYRWLREDAELSKGAIKRGMKIRFDKIYESFYYPEEEMRLRHIFFFSQMLPRKTLFQIMKSLNSKFNKQWFEIDEDEEQELTDYFNRNTKR